MYVDLGEVAATTTTACGRRRSRRSSAKANEILHPYTLDVKQVAWHSVYEVGHRVTDGFDDVHDGDGTRASSSPATPATRTARRRARA
jgi:phenol 2-monooxygenase